MELREGLALSMLWADFPAPVSSDAGSRDRTRVRSIRGRRLERLWTHDTGSPGIYRRIAAR